jgi:hypothetical protein
MTTPGSIAWYADETNPDLAAVRLRMLQPIRELKALGVDVSHYGPTALPGTCHTLVFSKCLATTSLDLARFARLNGLRIVYDVCDYVYAATPTVKQRRRMQVMSGFLQLADDIVFSTETLRQQVMLRYPDIAGRSRVIPDMLESLVPPPGGTAFVDAPQLTSLRHFLQRHATAMHTVWFGSNMGSVSGLVHVDAAVRELEIFSATRPVTLTVISDDVRLFRAARRNWRIPTHYLPWSLRWPGTTWPSFRYEGMRTHWARPSTDLRRRSCPGWEWSPMPSIPMSRFAHSFTWTIGRAVLPTTRLCRPAKIRVWSRPGNSWTSRMAAPGWRPCGATCWSTIPAVFRKQGAWPRVLVAGCLHPPARCVGGGRPVRLPRAARRRG